MISSSVAISLQNLPSAVFYVEVRDRTTKDFGLGTAFHLGSGYFATAQHVVAGKDITKMGRSDMSRKTIISPDGSANYTTSFEAFEVNGVGIGTVYCHPDENVDVAIIHLHCKVPSGLGYSMEQLQPAANLCPHTDKLTEGEFLMSEVIVLGYPRIPKSQPHPPGLVAYRGDISSTIVSQVNGRRHFVVTGMARGGFSGGPLFLLRGPQIQDYKFPHIETSGKIVGVIVKSLLESSASGGTESAPAELGFVTAISIEAINEVAIKYGLQIGPSEG